MLNNPYDSKREFFDAGNTRSYNFRLSQLISLKNAIEKNEDEIINALSLDLGKPPFEAYTAEIGFVYNEINHAIKNLKKWIKPKRLNTPIYLQPANSYIYPEPKGIVLIVSPWNYPFQLSISPLIGAIAAGNCVLLKPSHQAKNTEYLLTKIIEQTFSNNYISVVTGPGSSAVSSLINNHRFDHIFFTGSVEAGKKVLESASKYLTPVTLELGGKSPVIVHEDADLDIAAKRITWAKFYNAGQTCIAPDYLLVHESKKDLLIQRLKFYIKKYYDDNEKESNNIGRIISDKKFDRLISLIENSHILEGGFYNREKRFISPTLVDGIDVTHPLMKEEIFGPLLPILTYNQISDVINIVRLNPYPLALYLFTESNTVEEYIMENIQFGGGCINNAIYHIVNSNLPFGGVGYSGMGRYHSKYSFDTFTHEKSIFKSYGKFDSNLIYPPYKEKTFKLVKKILK
ncbi:aldehyde dehydrogenase [Tissierella sp. Yu-01]|uniref:aldehyde dehydrogenase n=1 Tax=Tissierella sp. Yu-01 TaxID=3035694 RepID=UPI00240D13EC|nr:aldehyde dehydrogenase [Tissierella sp. Yu-01]WFA09011.1 aldehyde dehydrogenase [Tissierella sp. Yu-01]